MNNVKNLSDSNKVFYDLKDAIIKSGLKDGMTISFHHHFRNGDAVINQVMSVIAELGIKNLKLAASSLIDVHEPLIEYIKKGIVTKIETSGIRGKLADEISNGLMKEPVIFRSHGNRAAAIASGELNIDVAFLGVPSTDCRGNANGFSWEEECDLLCGSIGYAMVDAKWAKKTILLTPQLAEYPNTPSSITEDQVDMIVLVNNIGDPKGIVSGATRYTKNPKELLMAEMTAKVIDAVGILKNNFSMQMGTGGASLATARFLKEIMVNKGIVASFALGGITQQIVEMHEEGLIKKILDVQSFDLGSAHSARNNRFHTVISASQYASSLKTSAVNSLDVVILSALEIDTSFNVNVLTGSDGVLRGAIGGHPDTAAGAKCSIIIAPLTRGRIPTVVKHVDTMVTEGKYIDILVTERGIAVNPQRKDLAEMIMKAGLPLKSIDELQQMAEKMVGCPKPIPKTNRIVGIVLNRNGELLDKVYQVLEEQ